MQGARVWLAVVVVVAAAGRSEGLYLLTYPSGAWKVPEDTLHNITVSLRFNKSEEASWGHLEGPEGPEGLRGEPAVLEVTALHHEPWRLDWYQGSAKFSAQEVTAGVNKTLTFSGYYWGTTHVGLYLTRDDLNLTSSNLTLLRDDLQITVDRKTHTLDTVLISLGFVFVLINNTNMGAQLDLEVIKSVLRRPLGPAWGFVSQFLVMPLSTFAMGQIFFTDILQRLGLFTLGCSPGGVNSNFWTLIFGGDINLSITMTAVSTVAAMGMMPLWMFTLGRRLTGGSAALQVPYKNLVMALVTLSLPVGLGMVIRLKRPAWADRGAKIIKPFTLCILVFFLGMWIYNSYKVFTMLTWQLAVAGVLVSGLGFSLGALFALILRLPRPQVIAISIETAFQNGSVVLILLKLSLPSPDSDLAAIAPMTTMLMTGPPLLVMYFVYSLLHRFCGCCPTKEPLTEAKEDYSKLHHQHQHHQESEDLENENTDSVILYSSNIFSDEIIKENQTRYGIPLHGMTKIKLMREIKETPILS